MSCPRPGGRTRVLLPTRVGGGVWGSGHPRGHPRRPTPTSLKRHNTHSQHDKSWSLGLTLGVGDRGARVGEEGRVL